MLIREGRRRGGGGEGSPPPSFSKEKRCRCTMSSCGSFSSFTCLLAAAAVVPSGFCAAQGARGFNSLAHRELPERWTPQGQRQAGA